MSEESHAPTAEELADLYRPDDDPKFIIIRIPVINSKCTSAEMKAKIFEELAELMKEIVQRGEVLNTKAALSEMFDVVQVMAGYMYAKLLEQNYAYPQAAVESVMAQANWQHVEKIKLYARERGWEVFYP